MRIKVLKSPLGNAHIILLLESEEGFPLNSQRKRGV